MWQVKAIVTSQWLLGVLQHGDALRGQLKVHGSPVHHGRFVLYHLKAGTSSARSTPHQNHEGVAAYAVKLKGERSVEDHDDDGEDPLKDGGGVLEHKALLDKKCAT